MASPAAIEGTPCDKSISVDTREPHVVIRWLLVVFLALLLFAGLRPWLEKLGFGKLPGDLRFRLFGREWFIPLTSTVLLSFIAMGISKLF